MTERRLDGRTAVVTGGGRGIGANVARRLAGQGASVIVTARTGAEIESVAAELRAGGSEAWAVRCDVSDPGSVRAMAEGVGARLGHVDILVASAGTATSAPVGRIALDDWQRTIAVNATGSLLCIQAFLPAMLERGWGRLITVASIAGLTGGKYMGAYAASKHAVLGLMRCVAAEIAGTGVTANAVCPGYVDTEMTRQSVSRVREKTRMSADAALQAIIGQSRQGRLISPEEVGHTVLALCAEEAASVNGATWTIDGGDLLR